MRLWSQQDVVDLWRVLADAEHARLSVSQGPYLEEPPRVLLSAYHFILLVLSREDAGPQVGAIVHLHDSHYGMLMR